MSHRIIKNRQRHTKGIDNLKYEKNVSMHYNLLVDQQISIEETDEDKNRSKGKCQIEPFGVYSGRQTLEIPENRSTHYTAKVDNQIKIPLPGFPEFYKSLNESDEEITLTKKKKH